ncbi:hypothetical protein D3C84_42520 [compost metagenome]
MGPFIRHYSHIGLSCQARHLPGSAITVRSRHGVYTTCMQRGCMDPRPGGSHKKTGRKGR